MSKLKKDRTWIERSLNVLAQGKPATLSKHWSQYVEGVYPSHTSGNGTGCYLEDAWGDRYIDFIGGLGSLSLGYSNARVVEAVQRQAQKGCSHSLPTTLEVEVAELFCGLVPDIEAVRFFKNGKDAADCAIRAARAYTNRSVVLSDGYHGCSDLWTSLTPPALGVKDEFKIHPLSTNPDDIHWLKDDVACVIVEALKLSDGQEYRDWIYNVRKECKSRGIVFIIDEIITGFRVPDWTVSKWWALQPDLILLGKGIANGYPLSVIGGRRDILNASDYFFSTTFGGEAISLAACKATIEEIHKRNLEDLMFYGKRLQNHLNELHAEIKFDGYGTRAMLNVTNETTALFMQEAVKAGLLFGKAFFFNFAHLEANLESMVLNTSAAIIDRIKKGEVKLEGKAPQEAFKR